MPTTSHFVLRLEDGYRQVLAAIESMSGVRFVHDQLELAGWDVRIADAARVRGIAPSPARRKRSSAAPPPSSPVATSCLRSGCPPQRPRRARARACSPAPRQVSQRKRTGHPRPRRAAPAGRGGISLVALRAPDSIYRLDRLLNTTPGNSNPCLVCGSHTFAPYRQRSEDTLVVICETCSMGVVAEVLTDRDAFYGDDYFEGGDAREVGHSDYATIAERSVAWAAALVRLLTKPGRILAIESADGH